MQEIYKLAENHIKQNLDQRLFNPQIQIKELPDVLELPLCQEEIHFSSTTSKRLTSRHTVLATCNQPFWKVYVTAELDAQINALVSTRAIPRHKKLTSGDMATQAISLKRSRRGMLTDPKEASLMRAKRNIKPNSIILTGMLEEAFMVEKDQEVTLVVDKQGLEITTRGTALEDGRLNEQIEVRNNHSQKVIKGTVIAPATLRAN